MNYEFENNDQEQQPENNGFVNGEYRYGRAPQEGGDSMPQAGRYDYYGGGQSAGQFYGNRQEGGYEGSSYSYRTGETGGQSGYGYQSSGYHNNGYQNYGNSSYGSGSTGGSGNKPPKKKWGAGKKVLAILLAVVMLGLAGGGGYLAAKSLANRTTATTAFSRDDMQKTSEAEAESPEEKDQEKEKDTTQKESTGEWKLTTKAASENSGNASLSLDVTGVAEVALPAIVAITNTSVQEMQNYYNMWGYGNNGGSYEVTSAGSGIIIGQTDTDLLIVTNHHVIENAKSLSVCFCDDSVYDATVKGSDSGVDVALVYVKIADLTEETKNNIAVISLGSSEAMKIGQQVVAIGNALGQGQSVTTGIVSAKNRVVSTSTAPLLQTDAAINPGNSGGALLNMSGELIGINSAKYADTDVEGMGYAIPIDTVVPIIERIQNKVQRDPVSDEDACYIGIMGQTVTSDLASLYGMPTGVYLTRITEGGPFEAAGIQAGGILTALDGETVSTMEGLKELLTYYAAGETVTVQVSVLEGNEYVTHEYQVTLGAYKDMPQQEQQQQQPQNPNGSKPNGQ
ncbi:MAG: trypsin-like peptidase domain-containing protein [Lachnospiraceae bacterium]|nr:trypsin-like peptidase domain-containing protein [Lachnospiraceae bacterium]